jgi:hypothetical protein
VIVSFTEANVIGIFKHFRNSFQIRKCVILRSWHTKQSDPNFISPRISIESWLLFASLFSDLSHLDFLGLGYPSGIEKTFVSFFYSKSLQFDRTQCADLKYDIFFKWSDKNKRVKAETPVSFGLLEIT